MNVGNTGRKHLIFKAVAILGLVCAGLESVSNAGQGEGYQPAGSWAWSIESVRGAVPALVTLHKDGTVSISEGSMFLTPNGGKKSPGHGVWERTGPLSFGGTSLSMRYDPNGKLLGFARTRTALYFMNDPNHIQGVMYVETGDDCTDLGCPDPLSPDAIWSPLPGVPFAISGTRIQRVEVPE